MNTVPVRVPVGVSSCWQCSRPPYVLFLTTSTLNISQFFVFNQCVLLSILSTQPKHIAIIIKYLNEDKLYSQIFLVLINFNYSATSSRSTTAPQCQPKPEQLGFITPLSTCRDQDLHAEHWDVHFCQGKYIQLPTNDQKD